MPDVKIEVAAYKKNISDVASIRQPLVPPFTEKNDGNVLTAKKRTNIVRRELAFG